METKNLFDLQIDGESTAFLAETARWARFLSVFGLVSCGLFFLFGLFYSAFDSIIYSMQGMDDNAGNTASRRQITMVTYIVLSIIGVIPYIYLLRFAGRMKDALRGGDQATLNSSFSSLKSCFKFVGILTIITLAFFLMGMVFAIIAYSLAA